MSNKKAKTKKQIKTDAEAFIEKDTFQTQVVDEPEDDDNEGPEEFEFDVETEIEHQTPEVIAKELLITYLEQNQLAYPDILPNENRYQALGRTIGEMYNALLKEIRKSEK